MLPFGVLADDSVKLGELLVAGKDRLLGSLEAGMVIGEKASRRALM